MSTKSSLGRLNIGDKISSSIAIAHELAPILAMSNIKAGFVRSCPCCHIVCPDWTQLMRPAVLPQYKDDLVVDLSLLIIIQQSTVFCFFTQRNASVPTVTQDHCYNINATIEQLIQLNTTYICNSTKLKC